MPIKTNLYFAVAFAIMTTVLGAAGITEVPKKAKGPPPADWVKVDSKTFHFSFSVPKQWTQQGSDGAFTFDLTPAKAKEKGKNFGTVQITAAQSQAATLEGKVADLRESLPKTTPNSKLAKDEAITFGDHPAWLFVVETSTKSQVASPSPAPGVPAVMHDVIKKSRSLHALAVEGDVLYEVTFAAEGASYSSGLSTVNRVMDTFDIVPAVTPTAAASGASPAVPPASTPMPADSVKVENKPFGFHLFIPKAWEKNVVNDSQLAYTVPADAKDAPPGIFVLVFAKSHESSIDSVAAAVRRSLAAKTPAVKVTDDRAAELGGKPAWLFITEGTAASPAGKPKTTAVKPIIRMYRLVSLVNGSRFDVSFDSESDGYEQALPAVKQVIDSLSWEQADSKP